MVKKTVQDDDTDEIESEPEKPAQKDPRVSKQTAQPAQTTAKPVAKPQVASSKPAATTQPAPIESSPVQLPTSDGLLVKKRRLDKALSNRHLQENTRVEVFVKDPFFEQDGDLP